MGNPAACSADDLAWMVAHDLMVPFACLAPNDSVALAGERLKETGVVQLPVYEGGNLVGYVGEMELASASAQPADPQRRIPSRRITEQRWVDNPVLPGGRSPTDREDC